METPSSVLNKEKAVETAGSAQALQVVLGTSLAPASGMTVPRPPRPADPLTEHSRLSILHKISHGPSKHPPPQINLYIQEFFNEYL
ncbi:UNVERIFIED_CONTAM: hypothetical protein Sangu_2903800 [Sesamum angustifolium]|uniref:Uncharacterized protein n=1 Tax=Sesamum angustifolium TaxID=2727405 RepID=A0AAW2INS6_9LAMI